MFTLGPTSKERIGFEDGLTLVHSTDETSPLFSLVHLLKFFLFLTPKETDMMTERVLTSRKDPSSLVGVCVSRPIIRPALFTFLFL